jgi:nucleotide-binding universal stress UspA family protein
LKNILIATDGSELAGKAVVAGIQLAEAMDAHITFLTVTSPLATLGDQGTAFAGLPEAVRGQALAYLAADADRTLSDALIAAKTAGVGADSLIVENRHPHEAIIDAAMSRGADMILMASHGRSGIKAVLLGSVTQKVLTHSDLPVLVYRGVDRVALPPA